MVFSMPISEETFKKDILSKIPPRNEPPLPPDWLHAEMLERLRVLRFAPIREGMNVLEIGCGAHALTTVPLVYLVGETGRTVKPDARELPFPFKAFDLAVLVHGVRSLKNEETMVKVISEMLRVSERVFIAESLPVANNERQRAHLELFNLREEIFEALFDEKDDLHYPTIEKLKALVERAGGRIIRSGTFEPELPHYLAYIPREYVESRRRGKARRAFEKVGGSLWKVEGRGGALAGWMPDCKALKREKPETSNREVAVPPPQGKLEKTSK